MCSSGLGPNVIDDYLMTVIAITIMITRFSKVIEFDCTTQVRVYDYTNDYSEISLFLSYINYISKL